jgi:hypothetical protein
MVMAAAAWAPAWADPGAEAFEGQQTAPSPTPPADAVFEPARQSVRTSTEWLARAVDGWFGDKPFSDGGKVTDGRLSLFLLTRQHEKPDATVRFNARFWLPNLEDRAYLFLGRDDVRETVTDQPDGLTRQQRLQRDGNAPPSFFAGLGWLFKDSLQLRLGFRGGLKPYAHARYATVWEPDEGHRIEFRETLFWARDDRFGATTVLSYELALSPSLALRWLNAATVTQASKKFEWNSSLGAYRSFGSQRLLSLEMLFSGLQGTGVPVNDTGLQVKWSQPVHKDWLLGEVLVGHFWPRPDAQSPRTRAWALGAGLAMRF